MNLVPLDDLPLPIRRQLPYNAPQLNAYADAVESELGLPKGWLNAIKNAGEKSGSLATSPKGAKGVMQFIPGTAQRFGLKDPTDPLEAIRKAGEYGRVLAAKFGGDPLAMAAAYNAGENHSGFRTGNFPEETTAYRQRVADALKLQSGNADAPPTGVVPIDDLPHELRNMTEKKAENQLAEDRQRYAPTSDSALENFAAGAGKSVYDTARGLGQLVGLVPQSDVDEAQRLDAPLMDTTAGTLGNITGQVAQTALPVAGATRTATALAKVAPKAAIALGPAGVAAATGAGFNATQPVVSGDSRVGQAAEGAVLGAAGQGVLNAAGALVRPAATTATAAVRDLAAKAVDKFNIPLTAAQVSSSPVMRAVTRALDVLPGSGAGKHAALQQSRFNEALNKTYGQAGDNVTEGLKQANIDLGKTYDDLAKNNAAKLGMPHLNAMEKAIDDYSTMDLSAGKSQTKGLWNIASSILDATDANGEMPGTVYKALRSKIGKARVSTTDPNMQDALKTFQSQLDDAMKSNLSNPDDLALWLATDKKWANMKTVEKLAPKDASGNVDMTRLASVLSGAGGMNAGNRSAMIYGKGDQTLPDLARVGREFLGAEPPLPQSMARRYGPMLGRVGQGGAELAGISGGLYAMNHDEESPAFDTAKDVLGVLAGAKGVGHLLRSQAFRRGSPALTSGLERLSEFGLGQGLNAYVNAAKSRVLPTPQRGGLPAVEPQNYELVPESDLPR